MTPYYEDKGIVIYHADAREVLPHIGKVDLTLTDPPYGIAGSSKKGDYIATGWEDTEDYIVESVIPIISQCLHISTRGIITSGKKHMWKYPRPDDIGCFWRPAAVGVSAWGLNVFSPIMFYGKDPRAGKGWWPNGKQITSGDKHIDHPCPKPLDAWQWLLEKGSAESDDVVLDPFMGSGTTLRAAKNLGRKAIGIEIEERYCEVAAERMSQEVLFGQRDGTERIAGDNPMFTEVSVEAK